MNSEAVTAGSEVWETISSQLHYQGAHLAVVTEEVRTPSQRAGRRWTVVRRKAAVVIAPMTAAGKLVLIRQERIPIRAAIWEMPAGQIDDAKAAPGEIAAVALRELQEETGYRLRDGGKLVPLGHFFSSPGFTDERGYLFLATPVEFCESGHAHHETETIVACDCFSPGQLAEMIAAGEIRDANTLSICARLAAAGYLSLHA